MTYSPMDCDDYRDAAAQAIKALAGRLARRDLRLTSPDALRDLLAAALQLATVEEAEEVEGEIGICPGCSDRLLPDPRDLLCPVCTAEEGAEARPLEELF